ncbi:hypothetical protein EVAR_24468_1 [Eumeta japonica]|uniref:Uncharacterized protein n=1 Tax=Eumeta variegata TaxID=151549 RepID=A0A4C1WX95_EUMVA|nr:hypothetical protein EVAR_24468_1 [Eumeta japonica]
MLSGPSLTCPESKPILGIMPSSTIYPLLCYARGFIVTFLLRRLEDHAMIILFQLDHLVIRRIRNVLDLIITVTCRRLSFPTLARILLSVLFKLLIGVTAAVAAPLTRATVGRVLVFYTYSDMPQKSFLAKGLANTFWVCSPVTPNPKLEPAHPPNNYAPFGVSGLVPFSPCDWLKAHNTLRHETEVMQKRIAQRPISAGVVVSRRESFLTGSESNRTGPSPAGVCGAASSGGARGEFNGPRCTFRYIREKKHVTYREGERAIHFDPMEWSKKSDVNAAIQSDRRRQSRACACCRCVRRML